MMRFWLLAIPTFAYLGIALVSAYKRDWSSATVFIGYTLGNCGFLMNFWLT